MVFAEINPEGMKSDLHPKQIIPRTFKTLASVMENRGGGHVLDGPSALVKAEAQIHVFDVVQVLVQEADLGESGSPQEHGRARDSGDLAITLMVPITHQTAVENLTLGEEQRDLEIVTEY